MPISAWLLLSVCLIGLLVLPFFVPAWLGGIVTGCLGGPLLLAVWKDLS